MKLFAALVLVVLLAGCATTGKSEPESETVSVPVQTERGERTIRITIEVEVD